MSRHLRRIERMDSARERRDPWETISILPGVIVQRLRATGLKLTPNPMVTMRYRVGWTGLPIDEPATITSLDADHAVALEREAIAQMVSRCAEVVRDNPLEFRFGGRAEADRLSSLAEDIRNGLHHANTPPNAQKQG